MAVRVGERTWQNEAQTMLLSSPECHLLQNGFDFIIVCFAILLIITQLFLWTINSNKTETEVVLVYLLHIYLPSWASTKASLKAISFR